MTELTGRDWVQLAGFTQDLELAHKNVPSNPTAMMKAALAAALGLLGANAAGDNGVWQNPAPCFAFFAARGLSTVAIKSNVPPAWITRA